MGERENSWGGGKKEEVISSNLYIEEEGGR